MANLPQKAVYFEGAPIGLAATIAEGRELLMRAGIPARRDALYFESPTAFYFSNGGAPGAPSPTQKQDRDEAT